jgi:hypothetical protein
MIELRAGDIGIFNFVNGDKVRFEVTGERDSHWTIIWLENAHDGLSYPAAGEFDTVGPFEIIKNVTLDEVSMAKRILDGYN